MESLGILVKRYNNKNKTFKYSNFAKSEKNFKLKFISAD